jgi:DNA primase
MPLVMPPRIYELSDKLWNRINPWGGIPLQLAKKYGWYVTQDNFGIRLVMPIFRKGEPVFYASRDLTGNAYLKYTYPKGVEKQVWISKDKLVSPVVLTEGIADAVYASQVFPSVVALLGNYLMESVIPLLVGKVVVVMLDGDIRGFEGTARIVQGLLRKGIAVTPVYLPEGKDPTDLTLEQLRQHKRSLR